MKKSLIVAALVTASAASAQSFQISAGGSFGAGSGVHVGLTAQNLTRLQGAGVDFRFSVDARQTTILNVDALVNFASAGTSLYGGGGLTFGTSGAFYPNIVVGANLPVSRPIGAFAEAGYRFGWGAVGRFGVTYSF